MIRVAIVADTAGRARTLTDLLGEDERLEVVDARVIGSGMHPIAGMVDVVVAGGLPSHQIPTTGALVVAVSEAPLDEGELGPEIRAWLPADISAAELSAAVFAVANDLVVLTPGQSKRLLRLRPDENGHQWIEALTPRELQVLRMLADGLGNKEIAQRLGISDHTAKFHVAQILAKLGAASRTEAVALGIRRGLVPI